MVSLKCFLPIDLKNLPFPNFASFLCELFIYSLDNFKHFQRIHNKIEYVSTSHCKYFMDMILKM